VARGGVHFSNFIRLDGTSMLAAMTTTAQELWALGDYDRIAELLADMGRDVVAAAEVGPGMRVLDVGAGTGNAALPAAAAGAEVVATDVTPELLAVGERHARERGLSLRWQVADAQALPFADGEFDAVLSCIGAIFAPDHRATAHELLRVCRPGGTVVMANWTPDGGVREFFELLGRHGFAGGDGPPPTAWGDPAYVAGLLAAADVHSELRPVRLGFSGPPGALAAHYRRNFPPVVATAAALDEVGADRLERDLAEFFTAPGSRPYDTEAKGAGASQRAPASEERTEPGSRPSDAEEDTGGPPCYELEYLLVRARLPVRPGP
jgi:SAM-dependent methyltransferase